MSFTFLQAPKYRQVGLCPAEQDINVIDIVQKRQITCVIPATNFRNSRPKSKFSIEELIGKNNQVMSNKRNEYSNYNGINVRESHELHHPNEEYFSHYRTHEFPDQFSNIRTNYYPTTTNFVAAPVLLGGRPLDHGAQRYYAGTYDPLAQTYLQPNLSLMNDKNALEHWLRLYGSTPHPFPGYDPSMFYNPFHKPKRLRTAFSSSQLLELENAFEKNHYVVGSERRKLSQKLRLTETQIKVWFQNRRTKLKRKKQDTGCHSQSQNCCDHEDEPLSSEEESEKSSPSFTDVGNVTNPLNCNSPATNEPIWNPHIKNFSNTHHNQRDSYTM
ncbi:homeotic protein empty spiracles [Trichonephila inaurata madagascariensis]|uniref:Homeotic protein empty spiracles n=1 Tax=Trichonephila inaurata madagascariensis TaxID=2747483 RepID=A0A8X6Y3C2_9ARAC|nr:homeotic protein empty spiracles [Trichonephila inaurata madagascariensis]